MKSKKILKDVKPFVKKNKWVLVAISLLFLLHIFLRFYQLEERAQFTWDQVDNAWHAKNMIINGEYPLTGMPAKGNTSVTIGPFYYYFVASFYLLTNLDPIASPIIAGIISIFSFFVLFFAARKIFNTQIALIAVFINTFSNYLITMDRIQWPVDLIAPVSLLIYLSMLQIIKGELKYIFLLATLLGFSLHIHFTSVFYFLLVILALPLFPRSRKAFLFILYSIPFFLVWTISFFLSLSQTGSSLNIFSYIQDNSIGFHGRRVLQVAQIAFVEIQLILYEKLPGFIKFLPIPLFLVVYYFREKQKNWYLLYLTTVWFIVPWFGLSMFGGELTPYYFSMTRYLAIIALAYVFYNAIVFRKKVFIPILGFVAILFAAVNIYNFGIHSPEGLSYWKKEAYRDFKESRGNEFTYGSAKTYLYYFNEYRAYGKK